jgi:ABC-2 type transport system permease protein
MTVFKTFWKVVNKYKGTIIGYTVMLLVFGTLSMSSSDVTSDFKSSKPDVIIIDNDKSVLSNNLVKYFNDNANILDIDLEEEKIDDALFYRDANYVIYIDEGYEDEVLNGNNPLIKIKSSGDYSSSLAEMLLERYLKTQRVLHDEFSDKNILVEKINNSLKTYQSLTLHLL